jgi:hypothetical protein
MHSGPERNDVMVSSERSEHRHDYSPSTDNIRTVGSIWLFSCLNGAWMLTEVSIPYTFPSRSPYQG